MSNIRVRGWHSVQKRMYSPEELAADQLTLLPTGEFINVSGMSTKLSTIFPVDKFVPLLSTGTTDIDKKEVFQDDIVSFQTRNGDTTFIGKVIWLPEVAGFVVDSEHNYFGAIHYIHNLKVIGNVRENPELLE